MDNISFGNRLKYARLQKKMTAEQLAEKVDLNPKSIWQIESGRRSTSISALVEMCNALNTKPDFFLEVDLKEGLSEKYSDDYIEVFLELTEKEREMALDYALMLIKNRNKYRGL